jgi:hypothetical protein
VALITDGSNTLNFFPEADGLIGIEINYNGKLVSVLTHPEVTAGACIQDALAGFQRNDTGSFLRNLDELNFEVEEVVESDRADIDQASRHKTVLKVTIWVQYRDVDPGNLTLKIEISAQAGTYIDMGFTEHNWVDMCEFVYQTNLKTLVDLAKFLESVTY